MKKKLIMAAAIAFAVFAIPYGSNALSTVSVASENNTVVATPTPKPVAEVKNAIDSIEITDEKSAFDARNTLGSLGVASVQNAMNNDFSVIQDVAALEKVYLEKTGLKAAEIKNSGSVEAVGVVGAALNASGATLNVSAPKATPSVATASYQVDSTPVYVEISLTNQDGGNLNDLTVPVAVTIKVPAGVDGSKAVIFHFNNGAVEEAIKPIYNASANTLTFTVQHFSTFAIAEATATAAEDDGQSSAFTQYRENLANTIANAKDGATIKITRDQNINALPNDIMQALYKKQTVALELEYTFQGNEYTVTIPAGKAENNEIAWYGPLYLQMRYGK